MFSGLALERCMEAKPEREQNGPLLCLDLSYLGPACGPDLIIKGRNSQKPKDPCKIKVGKILVEKSAVS